MRVLETERLMLRWMSVEDAPFILELVNDPDWLRYIGDRNIHDLDAARDYVINGPAAMYEQHGFGLFLVTLKADATPIGICGLLKPDTLEDVDIGFAFLPAFRALGYALESAIGVMDYGRNELELDRIVAITSPGNERSIQLLEKLGMELESTTRLVESEPEVLLFAG